MNQPRSDALVIFGATGDLAYKKIFPALHAMNRRGHLDVPVIGVARAEWSTEQLRARAQQSIREHAGGEGGQGQRDGDGGGTLANLLSRIEYVRGD